MRMRSMACAAFLSLFLAGIAWAQIPEGGTENPKDNPLPPAAQPQTEPESEGLEQAPSLVVVGRQAPGFDLEDSAGHHVRLSDLKGQWAVLMFTEDHRTLAPFKAIDAGLRQAGARLYAICQDREGTVKSYAEREQLPFEVLSDKTADTFRTFGMYDAGNGVVESGLVLLDPKGVVRMSVLGPGLHADEVLQLTRHTVNGS